MEPWKHAEVVRWCRLLLDSYRLWTGRDLIGRDGPPEDQASRLFHAPCVVVSHGAEDDPVLNYGNQVALELWEATWEEFIRTPSRVTAEEVNQEERARMLAQAAARGYIDDYRGVRISARGRRFLVRQALVWNVVDEAGRRRGQAATFSEWTHLESGQTDARSTSPRS